jgi:hypothetical protein
LVVDSRNKAHATKNKAFHAKGGQEEEEEEEEEVNRLPWLGQGGRVAAGCACTATALPLRCAASTMLSSALLAI